MKSSLLAALLLGLSSAMCVSLAFAQDYNRGVRNYQDVMSGRKKLDQLTPQERQEVVQVHRHLEAAKGDSGQNSACREARSNAKNGASDLANYTRRLRSCAEAENYDDDCSSEFRRVKNSQSDYESAVSSVRSNCR